MSRNPAEAEEADFKADGKWHQSARFKLPEWMKAELLDDNEPIGHQAYLMSARLSILYQTDLTSQTLLERERAKSAGRTLTAEEYAKVNKLSAAAARSKAALEAGRAAMRKIWTTAYKDDTDPCPAPIVFTAEDYLSSLMVVDSMASCGDVGKWFPPLVRHPMFLQDVDVGLRAPTPVKCYRVTKATEQPCCICGLADGRMGRPISEVASELSKKDEFDVEPQFCPAQMSWCSRDRTFTAAAGTMILLADTPYRAAFLSEKNAKATQP